MERNIRNIGEDDKVMWYGRNTPELINLKEEYKKNLDIIQMGKWNLSMEIVTMKIMFTTLKWL